MYMRHTLWLGGATELCMDPTYSSRRLSDYLFFTEGAVVANHFLYLLSTRSMVFYFTSNTVSPSAFIYVGKDKVESKSKSSFCSLNLV
jgi:hypothetical protein